MAQSFIFDGKAMLPKAQNAPEFRASGQEWSPHVQIAGDLAKRGELSFFCGLIKSYADFIAAYYLFPDRRNPNPVGTFYPGRFNIELQFAETYGAFDALGRFLMKYEKARVDRQPIGFDKAPGQKRVHCDRFYRLGDGRRFLCLGKWDSGRKLWGKVLIKMNRDGTWDLANEVVSRAMLQRCQIIPRNQEPFDPAEIGRIHASGKTTQAPLAA